MGVDANARALAAVRKENNLIFFGIPEKEGAQLKDIILDIFDKAMNRWILMKHRWLLVMLEERASFLPKRTNCFVFCLLSQI